MTTQPIHHAAAPFGARLARSLQDRQRIYRHCRQAAAMASGLEAMAVRAIEIGEASADQLEHIAHLSAQLLDHLDHLSHTLAETGARA